jgi:hypothetical protein
MRLGVISEGMTSGCDLAHKRGMPPRPRSDEKERRLCVMPVQKIEQAGRGFGVWPVVKG